MNIKKYTETHEWISVTDDIGIVGITRFAEQELNEVVYVKLPEIGQILRCGEEAAVLESTKAAADIYAPVSGEVIEINPAIANEPNVINQTPEEHGWLFKLRLTKPAELDDLLDERYYHANLPFA